MKQVPAEIIDTLWSLASSIYIVGGIIGSAIVSPLADRCGRINTVVLSQIPTLVGAVLGTVCKVADSPELLIVSRLICGVHSGIATNMAPIIIAEISPEAVRGLMQGLSQTIIPLGMTVAAIFGLPWLLCQPPLWPYVVLLQLVPAIVTSVVLIAAVPETPRHLFLHRQRPTATGAPAVTGGAGRDASDGLDAVRRSLMFYRRKENVDEELAEMLNMEGSDQKSSTLRQLMKKKSFTRPVVIATVLQVMD